MHQTILCINLKLKGILNCRILALLEEVEPTAFVQLKAAATVLQKHWLGRQVRACPVSPLLACISAHPQPTSLSPNNVGQPIHPFRVASWGSVL